MCAVHLGRDPRGRAAAVKVLRPEPARDESMVRRFRREADAASAVRGPGVAPVLGYDLDGPVPWLAAAYLAGPTLHEAVTAYGPFTEAGARALLAELARAVTVIHEAGLVHRDLKPSNIVLTREGARVIDFGIARPEYGLTLTQPGLAPATPGYAPPEQITGRRAGPAADVFALGAVLTFTCTGRAPFGSGHPAAVGYRVVHEEPHLDGVPEALVDVIRACLTKDAAHRPSPGELVRWGEGSGADVPGFGGRLLGVGPPVSGGSPSGPEGPRWGILPGRSRPVPAQPAPWLTPLIATEIDRRATGADALLRTVAPGRRASRRAFLVGAAGVSVAGTGVGVWWVTGRGRSAEPPERRTENGVPVAEPLASPTADIVPAALWQAGGVHPAGPGPVTVGQVVAAGAAEGVGAWVQHTGRPAWSWTGDRPPDRQGALLVAGTAILVVTGGGGVTALDSRTGRPRWRTADIGAVQTLAVDDRAVYVLDRQRHARAVDLTDRRIGWTSERSVGGSGTARAAVTRQRLVISTDDGLAQVLDTLTGATSWTWNMGRPVLWKGGAAGAPAPAVHDGGDAAVPPHRRRPRPHRRPPAAGPARRRRHGHGLPRPDAHGPHGRAQGGASGAHRRSGRRRADPQGDRRRAGARRPAVRTAVRRRGHGRRTAVAGHRLRPRPLARRGRRRPRPLARAARPRPRRPARHRAGRAAPGGRRPPGPQALQHPAHARLPGPRRLRYRADRARAPPAQARAPAPPPTWPPSSSPPTARPVHPAMCSRSARC